MHSRGTVYFQRREAEPGHELVRRLPISRLNISIVHLRRINLYDSKKSQAGDRFHTGEARAPSGLCQKRTLIRGFDAGDEPGKLILSKFYVSFAMTSRNI